MATTIRTRLTRQWIATGDPVAAEALAAIVALSEALHAVLKVLPRTPETNAVRKNAREVLRKYTGRNHVH